MTKHIHIHLAPRKVADRKAKDSFKTEQLERKLADWQTELRSESRPVEQEKIKAQIKRLKEELSKTKDALVYNGTELQWKEHAVEMHPGCTFRLDPVKSNIIRCRNKQGMNVGQYDTEKKSGSLEE